MSTLLVAAIQDVAGAGSKATLPITGADFTLGPGWGAWEWVSGTNISAVTNIDVQSFATGYDYQISIQGAIPGTDAVRLYCKLFQSATIVEASNDYATSNLGLSTFIRIGTQTCGNAGNEGLCAEVTIHEPNVDGRVKRVMADTLEAYTNGTDEYTRSHAGGRLEKNTDACDGIRFYWSSGDWTANGKIYVFRRRLS